MDSGKDASVSELTVILPRIDQGDPRAANELLPLVYEELHKLAVQKWRGKAPVKSYEPRRWCTRRGCRLVAMPNLAWNNRGLFFAGAAKG
jgi:hypothetical protein